MTDGDIGCPEKLERDESPVYGMRRGSPPSKIHPCESGGTPPRCRCSSNCRASARWARRPSVTWPPPLDVVDVPAGRTLTTEGRAGREIFLVVEGRAAADRDGRPIGTMGPASSSASRPCSSAGLATPPSEPSPPCGSSWRVPTASPCSSTTCGRQRRRRRPRARHPRLPTVGRPQPVDGRRAPRGLTRSARQLEVRVLDDPEDAAAGLDHRGGADAVTDVADSDPSRVAPAATRSSSRRRRVGDAPVGARHRRRRSPRGSRPSSYPPTSKPT